MMPTGGFVGYFSLVPPSLCEVHPRSYWVFHHNDPLGFCGMCWIKDLFEDEVPKRLYEYDGIADNGNPQMHWEFLRHLEAQLGLRPPLPDENLRTYRATREQYMQKPGRGLPVSRALWVLMGFQPKLIKPLVKILCGQTEEDYATQNNLEPDQVRELVAKAVRATLGEIRKK